MSQDTIFALSSGSLPSGVAIIRLSGPQSRQTLETVCGRVPVSRRASLLPIRDRNGLVLDEGLVLFFPGPSSFTGEDTAELQIHGGRATVKAVLSTLGALEGLRTAEAGEFSRRAFQNGRMDLVAVEGLADLVAAETEMQRRLAAEHASGHLSTLYDSWAKRLTHARAMIEAELDFADEEDVPGSVASTIWQDMRRLEQEIVNHLSGFQAGEIVRDGLNVVIAGPPNAGKSSLLNYLAQRDIAIVTNIPGTTRDVLHVDLDLSGFAVRLYDTAGLRDTDDMVEQEGIRRAQRSIAEAHLVLLLSSDPDIEWTGLTDGYTGPVLRVLTKADERDTALPTGSADVMISVKSGEGMTNLLDAVRAFLPDVESGQALSLPTRERHFANLQDARGHIESALAAEAVGLDIQAEHLRLAGHSLGRVTGRVDVENLLDVIFSEFCIGK
ncbi:tRNA uridine-5-carboxymethylaminomethyl(34) synthesis GTPase MnmE [Shinella sp. CPCC 101442]|uniref:tRNA uridine-5-carboxymethylaminomethyl(34) synthesis GTPase MnmE n=1 Tax=Shinella sp. CPCC 101442 TaxID=2932265 RepID=UPI002153A6F3|nr:tRNA uridine-5-carboxymethylaminomethyl(34) synthesis GTPase MnmE [Shinella sp. CPCC 101442]MCR6501477.1 tRNA uridine-5-carboxymethylaminomethyl(34) synthesis GTPase MnmE [Shinella sp. CPCC 101442]